MGQLVDHCNNPGRVHSGLDQNDDSENEKSNCYLKVDQARCWQIRRQIRQDGGEKWRW